MISHNQFLEMAEVVAKSSKCVSLQVGALIVKDSRVVSMGYNGTPPGYANCNEIHDERGPEHTEWSNKYEIHAEMNAIAFAAKNGVSIDNGTIYVTIEPCFNCLKVISAAGIKKIYFRNSYYREDKHSEEKKKFAVDNNIQIEQIT